jgi:hypothetical protein
MSTRAGPSRRHAGTGRLKLQPSLPAAHTSAQYVRTHKGDNPKLLLQAGCEMICTSARHIYTYMQTGKVATQQPCRRDTYFDSNRVTFPTLGSRQTTDRERYAHACVLGEGSKGANSPIIPTPHPHPTKLRELSLTQTQTQDSGSESEFELEARLRSHQQPCWR